MMMCLVYIKCAFTGKREGVQKVLSKPILHYFKNIDNFLKFKQSAGGGELLDILTKHSFLTEYDIALYIIQLLKALKHMHDFEIAHLGLTVSTLCINYESF